MMLIDARDSLYIRTPCIHIMTDHSVIILTTHLKSSFNSESDLKANSTSLSKSCTAPKRSVTVVKYNNERYPLSIHPCRNERPNPSQQCHPGPPITQAPKKKQASKRKERNKQRKVNFMMLCEFLLRKLPQCSAGSVRSLLAMQCSPSRDIVSCCFVSFLYACVWKGVFRS
jgi:hypothetical protein